MRQMRSLKNVTCRVECGEHARSWGVRVWVRNRVRVKVRIRVRVRVDLRDCRKSTGYVQVF